MKSYVTKLKKHMELSKQQFEFARNVAKLIEFIFSQGYSCTLGEAYRTPEQAEIYAKSGKGIKDSLHCQRMAIDLNLFDHQGKYCPDSHDYGAFGKFWEGLNPKNRWGGNFQHPNVDGNHFQQQLEK